MRGTSRGCTSETRKCSRCAAERQSARDFMLLVSLSPRVQLYEHMSIFAKMSRAAAGLATAAIVLSAIGFGSPSAAHAEPEPPVLPGATATEVTLANSPSAYGDVALFNVTVTLSAPVLEPIVPGRIEVDGQPVGSVVLLLNVGAGKYSALLPATAVLAAGTHSVVAFFDGTPGVGGGSPDALPSQSEPLEVTIAQRSTTTAITSAPSTFVGLVPIDVRASVLASGGALVAAPSGNAVLLADGAPLIYEDLDALGGVWFEDVLVPWGTEELTVAYLGDTAGNFATSTSVPVVVTMTPIATESTLSLSSSEIRADQSLTLTLRVEHSEASSSIDPSGGVEIFVDGNSYYSEYPSDNLGPASDRAAQFEVQLSDLLPGPHDIVARYIAADGFTGSESAAAEVVVTAVETVLTASANQVSGTPARPAGVDVTAAAVVPEGGPTLYAMPVAAGYPVDGYVQAFVGSRPLGDPVLLAKGAGHVKLSGLAVGQHDVELRFTPTEAGLLPSSARVLATITADANPNGSGGTGGSLSDTGSVGPMPYLAGALALALAGAGALLLSRRHRAL